MKTVRVGSLDINISDHSIQRYRERIMSHRHWNDDEPKSETMKKIRREIDPRNVLKVVNYGEKYKFIFTKKHTEFRFERSNDRTCWILVTCVRFVRLMESEEPIDISQIKRGHIYGIRTAIKIREKKKLEYEKGLIGQKEIEETIFDDEYKEEDL